MSKEYERYEQMITADTKKYWKQLAAIPWSKRGEIRTKLVPWIYTNDHGFDSIIDQIITSTKEQNRNGKLRAGVLSGVGSILNIAPHAEVDFFVCVDRNSFVLDQIRRMIQTMQEANTPDEYIQISQLETFFLDLRGMGADPEPYWYMEVESFGKRHFLASQENYLRSKKSLSSIPVFYTQGNFANPPYVEALGQALTGATVSYASFTDLAEWSPQFLDSISYLPFADDSVIVWSTNKNRPEGKPLARISFGINNYIHEQSATLDGLTVSYFKSHV